MVKCARPGCNNDAKNKYCSRYCANLDKERVKALKYSSTQVRENIPEEIITFFSSRLGQDASVVLDEIAYYLESEKKMPKMDRVLTENDALFNSTSGILFDGNSSYRPSDRLSYDRIAKMLRNGQVIFGIEMKRSWIRSALRNDRSWDVECQDEFLKNVIDKNFQHIFEKHSNDFLEHMVYGNYFGEKVFTIVSARSLGIDSDSDVVVYDKINSVRPSTIDRILYKDGGRTFDGFVQISSRNGMREIVVPADYAFVLPYMPKYGNLWGQSILDPVYPLWVWYEITYRSWVRYMERMGTPVTVCYAPSRGTVKSPTGETMRTMQYAYFVASNVSRTNAVAIPSDVDTEGGSPLWKIEYLSDGSNAGAKFQTALQELAMQMLRSMLISDRAIAQPIGESSSYAASRQHFAVTMLHNEHILQEIIGYVNMYLVPQICKYNLGNNAPVARIVTEGLDPDEREKIFSLLNTIGNRQGSDAFDYIDWKRIMSISNVPVLSEEEVARIREERKKSDPFANLQDTNSVSLENKMMLTTDQLELLLDFIRYLGKR